MDGAVATVKTALAARVAALTAALDRELPQAKYHAPEGGYFMWVELPEGTDVAKVFDAAAERGLAFVEAPTSCSRAARTRCGSPTPA